MPGSCSNTMPGFFMPIALLNKNGFICKHVFTGSIFKFRKQW